MIWPMPSRVEHVALAEQLLGALLVEDGAAVDLGRHLEADAGREVGLDGAGDDVDRRTLRRHDEMDAGGARHLRQPLHGGLDLFAGDDHQIGELIDDDDDVRHRLGGISCCSYIACPCVVESGLHGARRCSPRLCALRTRVLKASMLRTESAAMRL